MRVTLVKNAPLAPILERMARAEMPPAERALFDKHFSHVAFHDHGAMLEIKIISRGLDRTDVTAWMLKDAKLADRLVRAIESRKCINSCEVRTDIYGKTFLAIHTTFASRRMSSGLKRLGF